MGLGENLKSQIGWYVQNRRLTLTQLPAGTSVTVNNVLGQTVAAGVLRAESGAEASWTSAPLPSGLYTVQATGWSGSVKVIVP